MYQKAAQRSQSADGGFKGEDGPPGPAKRQFTQQEVVSAGLK